jgi:hypothetical protein
MDNTAIQRAVKEDRTWIMRTTISILAMTVAFFSLLSASGFMAFILLIVIFAASEQIRTSIFTAREYLHFSLFSTTLLFMMTLMPLDVVAAAALIASLLTGFINRQAPPKIFVNFVSVSLASLSALFAFSIPNEIVIGILIAGLVFEMVNSLTLLPGVAYFSDITLSELIDGWKDTWWVGFVPPLTAALLYIGFAYIPWGLPVIVTLFAFFSRPQYIVNGHSLHGCWHITSAFRHAYGGK